ncbi:MAG: hypothetical protein ACRBFS_20845 [Aureispira sp.]
MQKSFKLTILLSLIALLWALPSTQAQDKDDKKIAKTLVKQRSWKCKTLRIDGREVNVQAIVGDVNMDFFVRKQERKVTVTDKKGNEKKKTIKEKVNVFQMEMGGSDRIFNYNIKQDSVQFVGLKGWNDYRIVSASKEEVVLEHVLDDSLMRWIMVPNEEAKKEK